MTLRSAYKISKSIGIASHCPKILQILINTGNSTLNSTFSLILNMRTLKPTLLDITSLQHSNEMSLNSTSNDGFNNCNLSHTERSNRQLLNIQRAKTGPDAVQLGPQICHKS